tara:strand:+ start:2501 stop:2731 length:231 start_codon:yes stop_codon:yes gene_type:complete
MKNYFGRFESRKETDERIKAMLRSLVIETSLYCWVFDKPFPRFTRNQIADYCGCSNDTIRRIEENALSKLSNNSAK